MSDYEIGKQLQKLTQRLEYLEQEVIHQSKILETITHSNDGKENAQKR